MCSPAAYLGPKPFQNSCGFFYVLVENFQGLRTQTILFLTGCNGNILPDLRRWSYFQQQNSFGGTQKGLALSTATKARCTFVLLTLELRFSRNCDARDELHPLV